VRIGLIGCGHAALRLHAPAIRAIPGLTIHAVCDADPARMIPFAPARFHSQPDALIADPEVDAVWIGVPTRWHCELFLQALGAGKAVYIEKPLALTLEEAARMQRAARESSAPVVHGFNLRSHRLARRAAACVAEGRIGRIEAIRSTFTGSAANRSAWQTKVEEGGGPVFELGVHHFDLWRWLGGAEILDLHASGDPAVRASVSGELANGVCVSGYFAYSQVDSQELEILGEHGALRFSLYQADSWMVRPAGRAAQLSQWLRDLPQSVQAARRRGDLLYSYRVHWTRFAQGEIPATVDDGAAALAAVWQVLNAREYCSA
jgi:myo-inositol 2-dehydrogenase/D-chiro-inositol 1-dehydrogenase